MTLLLCFLLLHGFVNYCLFEHLAEALIKGLQSEITRRVGVHASAAVRGSKASLHVLNLVASRVNAIGSLHVLHVMASVSLLRDLYSLCILRQVLALKTFFQAL